MGNTLRCPLCNHEMVMKETWSPVCTKPVYSTAYCKNCGYPIRPIDLDDISEIYREIIKRAQLTTDDIKEIISKVRRKNLFKNVKLLDHEELENNYVFLMGAAQEIVKLEGYVCTKCMCTNCNDCKFNNAINNLVKVLINQEGKIDVNEAKEYLENFATKYNIDFIKRGEIGLGRDCVGLAKNNYYISYDSMNKSLCPPDDVIDAYYKDNYLAILVYNNDYDKAILQLYRWIRSIEYRGKVKIRQIKPNEFEIIYGKVEEKNEND